MCMLLTNMAKRLKYRLGNWLFGAVMLTKNADADKYGYSGYGIGFDARSEFSWSGSSRGKNAVIFGADISSSVHVDNTNKDILVLGKGPTDRLDDSTITAEAKYPINFTQSGRNLC